MKPALCLCAVMQPASTSSSVRVVVHDTELQKSTNSGRLLPLLLSKAALVPYGGPLPHLDPRCWPEGTRPVVLYPLAGAPSIETFVDATAPPVCLIVLDGTWRQATRLRKRFLVERVPFARLPQGVHRESVYQLRTGHFAQSMSTLEAAARALAILEGDPEAEARLLRPFRQMVDRTLWLRGSKDAKDVTGGIPDGVWRHDINARGFADDVDSSVEDEDDDPVDDDATAGG